MHHRSLPTARPLDTATIWAALRRRRIPIAAAVLVGLGIGWLVGGVLGRSYTATALVRADPLVVDLLDPGNGLEVGTLPGEWQELRGTGVIERALAALPNSIRDEELRDALTVTQTERGPVLAVTVTLDSPDVAMDTANAVAEAYVVARSQRFRADIDGARARLAAESVELGERLGNPAALATGQAESLMTRMVETSRLMLRLDYAATPGGEVISPATLPDSPDGIPTPVTSAAVGVLAGGAALAVALDRERGRCSLADLDSIFGLLHVDIPARALQERLIDPVLPSDELERSVRELRLRLRAMDAPRVVVLGLGSGPQASWLVAVLADLQARFGEPTQVVDFDHVELERWISNVDGVSETDSTALVHPRQAGDPHLLVAVPPMASDPLGLELARHADAVVLAFAEGAPIAAVASAVDDLHAAGARSIAAVHLVGAP